MWDTLSSFTKICLYLGQKIAIFRLLNTQKSTILFQNEITCQQISMLPENIGYNQWKYFKAMLKFRLPLVIVFLRNWSGM